MARSKMIVPLVLMFALAGLLGGAAVGCSNEGERAGTGSQFDDRVDGYIALVPSVLRAGETASFSFTLTQGEKPARSHVTVAVLDKSTTLAEGTAQIDGTGTVAFELPEVEPGEYTVRVSSSDFSKTARVQIKAGTLLFLETDKPIYKPGQTIQVRLVALDSELKPVRTDATVEVQDAKGIKIAKKALSTDEYGTVTMQLPLSTEPNLGVWKLSAVAGDATTQLDVRVEEYVLPKYEVKAEPSKDWFLVDEVITGRVTSKYSYGRAVEGRLKVVASRYVGEWEEYATYTAHIDGEGEFRIDAAGYVAGVPEAGGLGNVRLDITVTEEATGYEQTTTELLTVAESPLTVRLIPESTAFKPTLPFSVMVVTETPGGEPVEATVTVDVYFLDEQYNQSRPAIAHGRNVARHRARRDQAAARRGAHVGAGRRGRHVDGQGGRRLVLTVGEFRPRAAGGRFRPRRRRYGRVPRQLHRRGGHRVLRSRLARPGGLHK